MSSGWSVLAVRYGTLETTRSDAYYRYQAYGEPDGPQRLDYFFWIVRRGDETILVDTGFDPEVGRRRGRTCLIEPAEAMAQLGVSADTVSRVVLTHLHYEELERDRPFGVLADLAEMYEGYDTLRELSGAPDAQLVPGHDAEVMTRYPRVEGPAGEFTVEIR